MCVRFETDEEALPAGLFMQALALPPAPAKGKNTTAKPVRGHLACDFALLPWQHDPGVHDIHRRMVKMFHPNNDKDPSRTPSSCLAMHSTQCLALSGRPGKARE